MSRGTHHKATPPGDEQSRRQEPVERLQQELATVKDELARTKDASLRQLAEIDNVKKRLQREKDEFVKYAAESVVGRLLPIVDSLDQAVEAVGKPSDPQAVIQGIALIHRQLLGALAREGVERIRTIGEAFDPHRHEAVAQVDAGDGQADHTIIEEVQVGYTLHGKVIRPAMVKVATASTPRTPGGHPEQDTAREAPRGTQPDTTPNERIEPKQEES